MKPMGPIPPWFGAENGMLLIGGCGAASLVDEAGDTPLFAYDMNIIQAQVRRFRDAMPAAVHLHYAVKANPFAPLLARMALQVDGFDIASGGELEMALEADMAPERISFAGPGKRNDELSAAIFAGATINLESEGEARRALAAADATGKRPRLAIRVNPDFDLKGSGMRMGGGAKPFGVDTDRAAALARTVIDAGADWRGWHIFAGSQNLDPLAIIETQAATIALATRSWLWPLMPRSLPTMCAEITRCAGLTDDTTTELDAAEPDATAVTTLSPMLSRSSASTCDHTPPTSSRLRVLISALNGTPENVAARSSDSGFSKMKPRSTLSLSVK